MSWWQKLFGIEEAEQDLQEQQQQFLAEIQQSNIQIARTIAEQHDIQMAQCGECLSWYITTRGPWCGCK